MLKIIKTQNQAGRKDSFKNENEPFLLWEGKTNVKERRNRRTRSRKTSASEEEGQRG
jgi:hypothetical protein